jgi:hypothetical protein
MCHTHIQYMQYIQYIHNIHTCIHTCRNDCTASATVSPTQISAKVSGSMGAVSVNALCLTQRARLRRYLPRLVVTRNLETHRRHAALKERGGGTEVGVLSSLSGVPSLCNRIRRTGDGYTLNLRTSSHCPQWQPAAVGRESRRG